MADPEFDNDRYCTSVAGLAPVRDFFPQGITFDPCGDPDSIVDAERSFDLRRGEDCLELPWRQFKHADRREIEMNRRSRLPDKWRTLSDERGFVNPPYSRPGPMMQLCADFADEQPGEAWHDVIALIQPKVGTHWFQSTVYDRAAAVCTLRGRLSFMKRGELDNNPRHESCYVLWTSGHDPARREFMQSMFRVCFASVGHVEIL